MLVIAAVLGVVTAVGFLWLNAANVFGGSPALGIIGFVGSLPTAAVVRQLPASVHGGSRALIVLVFQSPLWSCFWYIVLKTIRRRNERSKG